MTRSHRPLKVCKEDPVQDSHTSASTGYTLGYPAVSKAFQPPKLASHSG